MGLHPTKKMFWPTPAPYGSDSGLGEAQRFVVEIPPRGGRRRHQRKGANMSDEACLVIDDDEDIREDPSCRLLAPEWLSSRAAADAVEALEQTGAGRSPEQACSTS